MILWKNFLRSTETEVSIPQARIKWKDLRFSNLLFRDYCNKPRSSDRFEGPRQELKPPEMG